MRLPARFALVLLACSWLRLLQLPGIEGQLLSGLFGKSVLAPPSLLPVEKTSFGRVCSLAAVMREALP